MENKKHIPALRFRGFDGPWVKYTLGELGTTYNGLNGKTKEDFGHGAGKFVTYLNIFNHPVADLKETESVELDDTQNQVKYGDIFFTTSSETPDEVGMSSVWLGRESNVYLNSFCFGYRPEHELYPYFMAYLLRSPVVRKKFIFLAQGISRYNISKNKVMDMQIFLPPLEEQKKIGKFFADFDEKIFAQEQKIKKAEQFRRAMLSKLFPAEGASEPALRFRGFSGAWKKCKLASFGKATGGVSLEAEFIENGTYKVINIGSYSGESKYIDQGLRTNKTKRTAARILNKNDLVMILNDKTSEGNIIGRVLLIDADDTYVYNQRNERIEVNQSQFVPQFLYELLNADVVRNKIIRAAQGATQIYVNWSVISQLTYMIPPSINEQKQIGDFFYQLDSYISLQREKREKLRRLKAALLEKLFV